MGLTIRSSRIILPLRHRKPRGRRITLTYGKAAIKHPDGTLTWIDDDWVPNFLADEGKIDVLDVYFREQAFVSKYLALLTATPVDATTMATMVEVFTPPLNGYAREQLVAGDWGAPILSAGDYMTTAAQKTLGLASGVAWEDMTYVALVSALTGTAGIFISAIPLSGSTDVPIGESLLYTMAQKGT